MFRQKHLFFYILFLIVMPFSAIFAQDVEQDTAIPTELDIKYDSALAKAASAISSSSYEQAVAFYKEASALKPAVTFPYKMIIYAEELAARQKHAEDLKRRAQIIDQLNKANQAIVNKSWDSARVLFSNVLTLRPEKADEEYAKSKIDAIDLERKRITARIPPKPVPVVVVLPKNRREARAQRKIAERNEMVAASATPAVPQKPAPTPLPQKTVVAAPAVKVAAQKPAVTPAPQKTIAAAPAVKVTEQKPTETPLPQKPIAAAPAATAAAQKPVPTPAPQKPIATTPAVKVTEQKPTETPLPQKTIVAAPAAIAAAQKPVPTPAPQKLMATAPAVKVTEQKPTETPLPQKTIVAPAATAQKPAVTPAPQKPIAAAPPTQVTEQKPAQTPLPQKDLTITEPVSKESSSTEAPLVQLSDSTDYTKLICQDISFIGTNAYIKVLIQNYSETASFTTDTLRVSIKKNNGTVTKLDQRFSSSFPVIAPLGEFVLVSFADAAVGIDPTDVFILEMRDRKKKIKLSVQIPWAAYQQQKNM